MARLISSYIQYTKLNDLVDKKVIFDPDPYNDDSYLNKDKTRDPFFISANKSYQSKFNIKGTPFLIRLQLNKEKMMNKSVTILDIKSKFIKFYDNRYRDVKGLKRQEKEIITKILQCVILGNNDNSDIPIIHIRFNMAKFDYQSIINFANLLSNTFVIKGLENINDTEIANSQYIHFNNPDESQQKLQENKITTTGVNLEDIRNLSGIDLNRTVCNDINYTKKVFGIEAARTILLKELNTVFSSSSVNVPHLTLLVDMMTNTGNLTSIDRHGINRLDTDPLSRASFEKTMDQLIQAAVYGEVDYMRSVSSRIMAGQVIKGGTGLCDIILDDNLLENTEYIEDTDISFKEFIKFTENNIIKDLIKRNLKNMFIP